MAAAAAAGCEVLLLQSAASLHVSSSYRRPCNPNLRLTKGSLAVSCSLAMQPYLYSVRCWAALDCRARAPQASSFAGLLAENTLRDATAARLQKQSVVLELMYPYGSLPLVEPGGTAFFVPWIARSRSGVDGQRTRLARSSSRDRQAGRRVI